MVNKGVNILILILAVIGAIAVIGVLSMWLMHATMMGGGMIGGNWIIGLLLIGVIVAAVFALTRSK